MQPLMECGQHIWETHSKRHDVLAGCTALVYNCDVTLTQVVLDELEFVRWHDAEAAVP